MYVGYGDTVQPGYLREFIQEEAPQQVKEKQGHARAIYPDFEDY